MSSVTLDHLQQHVRMEVQRHLEGPRHNLPWVALVFHGSPAWEGAKTFTETVKFQRRKEHQSGEQAFQFEAVGARSMLELRHHLAEAGRKKDRHVVILAEVPDAHLPDDVKTRLMHGCIREIAPWRVLLAEFGARSADARIRVNPELAIALLQHRPAGGFPAVTTGVLDRTTFWSCVCTQVLGLPSGDPTPREILAWSVDDDATRLLRTASVEVRDAARAWLAERSSLAAQLLQVAATVPASDLIPIGLVFGVVCHETATAHTELVQAEVRLQLITGHRKDQLKEVREWSLEAVHVLQSLEVSAQRRLSKRADGLLQQVQAGAFAYLSDVAPQGYEQRLVAFAKALVRHLDRSSNDTDLLAAASGVSRHWDGRGDSHRQTKVDMATRLARWLRSAPEPAGRLPDAMCTYQVQLAFVDWARHGVVGGDQVPELQAVYRRLNDLVLARREVFNRQFAELVVDWNRTPDQFPEILRIEDLNRRVVGEVATDNKVLVLVMDGMSWPVTQELLGHLERNYWTMRSRTVDGVAMPGPVMTTVPSVTEYARTSLLCGTLARGEAGDERHGFAEHHELRAVSGSGNPPVLFHRKDLEETGRQGLSSQILAALGNQKQRIVGVVVNAVDDHLTKDDGCQRTWNLESIRVLNDLLAAAGSSKRAIILCSDHGHVLDHWVSGATGTADGGERWHTATPRDGEFAVSGPRLGLYGSTLTAPWSEKLRYGGKKNGYHGGLTPQELIPPCLILAKLDHTIDGWNEVHIPQPAWWRLESDVAAAPVVPMVVTPKPKTKAPPQDPNQLTLFDDPQKKASWPLRLLLSPAYQQSSAQAGRRRPDDAQVLALLTALDAAPGGQMSERNLAELLHVPAVRMKGIVATVARMLNLEGYRILTYTDDQGYIRLDRQLAITQFELAGA